LDVSRERRRRGNRCFGVIAISSFEIHRWDDAGGHVSRTDIAEVIDRALKDGAPGSVLRGGDGLQEPLIVVSPYAAHALSKLEGWQDDPPMLDNIPVRIVREWNDWKPGG
jgi:hypothetical protein